MIADSIESTLACWTTASVPLFPEPQDTFGFGPGRAMAPGPLIFYRLDNPAVAEAWGSPGDRPVPADCDGDGRIDLAAWRLGTGERWIVRSRAGAVTRAQWRPPGDIPVPADYDGDGFPDLTVYWP